MTDAEYDALKARVLVLMDYWQPRLGLKWWRIYHHFVRDASEFKTDGNPAPDTLANCSADWRYLDAHISFNMHQLFMQDVDADELEYVVVHEYCHVLVNETRDPADLKGFIPHEERVCTTLAKAFIWTRDMTREE